MADRPAKQQKVEPLATPANVIIQFQSPEGDATGAGRGGGGDRGTGRQQQGDAPAARMHALLSHCLPTCNRLQARSWTCRTM